MGGAGNTSIMDVASGQPFFLNLASEAARVLGDPDWRVLVQGRSNYTDGVAVGYRERLPRTPAVFERKKRWRRYDEDDYVLELRRNYRSARESIESLRKVYNDEIREGRVVRMPMTDARKKFGDRLRIAPQGAVGKKDSDKRPIHDGAHGPAVNPNIRIRDQLRYPRGAELRYAAAGMARRGGATFGLTADV